MLTTKLASLLGIHAAVLGRRVAVGAGDGEIDNRRELADGVIEAIGREVDPSLGVDGRDPADRRGTISDFKGSRAKPWSRLAAS